MGKRGPKPKLKEEKKIELPVQPIKQNIPLGAAAISVMEEMKISEEAVNNQEDKSKIYAKSMCGPVEISLPFKNDIWIYNEKEEPRILKIGNLLPAGWQIQGKFDKIYWANDEFGKWIKKSK